MILGLAAAGTWAWRHRAPEGGVAPGARTVVGIEEPVSEHARETGPTEVAPGTSPPAAPAPLLRRDSGAPDPDRFLALRRALVPLEVRDADGVLLRRLSALPLAPSGDLLVPVEFLNGAEDLREARSGRSLLQVLWWEQGGLCLLDGSPLSDPQAEGTAQAQAVEPGDLSQGEELYALVQEVQSLESCSRAGLVAGIDEHAVLLRGGPALTQRFVFRWNGALVGIGVGGQEGLERVRPAAFLARTPVRAGATRLAALARFFDVQALARRERAVLYAAGHHWLRAVQEYTVALELDPLLRDSCEEGLLSCLHLLREEGAGRGRAAPAPDEFLRAAQLLRDSAEAWELLGALHLEQGRPLDAVLALLEALRHLPTDPMALTRAVGVAYLQAAEEARARGLLADAEQILREALGVAGAEDLLLLKSLGYVLYESGDDAGAWEVLQEVAARDAGQAASLGPLLQQLEDDLGRPVVAVIEFDPNAGAILSQATINDRRNLSVMVDTGASLTALSRSAAERLGLWPTQGVRQVEVITAGGRVVAPVVVLESVNLQGAWRRNVEAVILDLDSASAADALIGLNFLQSFDVAIDSRLGVMKLRPRR